jgi:hypothetical protein
MSFLSFSMSWLIKPIDALVKYIYLQNVDHTNPIITINNFNHFSNPVSLTMLAPKTIGNTQYPNKQID